MHPYAIPDNLIQAQGPSGKAAMAIGIQNMDPAMQWNMAIIRWRHLVDAQEFTWLQDALMQEVLNNC